MNKISREKIEEYKEKIFDEKIEYDFSDYTGDAITKESVYNAIEKSIKIGIKLGKKLQKKR